MAKTKLGTMSILCAAVAAYYREEGDLTKAGVVVACLDHNPERFYASVARYPDGPFGKKQIVVSTRDLKDLTTAEDAVEEVARRWYSEVNPPTESALKKLGEALGLEADRGG